MTVCNKSHRYNTLFDLIGKDQGGVGRHKCCGCAYELGLDQGSAGLAESIPSFNALDNSQAGNVRHKNTEEAFRAGYKDGVAKYNKDKQAATQTS